MNSLSIDKTNKRLSLLIFFSNSETKQKHDRLMKTDRFFSDQPVWFLNKKVSQFFGKK